MQADYYVLEECVIKFIFFTTEEYTINQKTKKLEKIEFSSFILIIILSWKYSPHILIRLHKLSPP